MDRDVHARLAANIRDLADARGLAVSVLADLAGVGRGHFFEVLAGRSSPSLEWMSKIATALGVDVTDLLALPPTKP